MQWKRQHKLRKDQPVRIIRRICATVAAAAVTLCVAGASAGNAPQPNIVTFYRWVREGKHGKPKTTNPKGGQRKPKEIRELVIEIAKTTGFGQRIATESFARSVGGDLV